MKKSILFLFALILVLNVSADEFPKVRFGKVTKAELELKTCEIDSGAHAMYLIDDGFTDFSFVNDRGFVIQYSRYSKIKIFDKEGDEYATIKIPYYVSSTSSSEERVSGIKAYTYNLENGKIVKTKLSSKDVYDENVNGNWWEKRFSMPNVKPGSVLEIRYEISSDFLWNLPSWYFQHEIPVQWSRYETAVPEYYEYDRDMKGYIPVTHEYTGGSITIGDFSYLISGEKIIAHNVLAFKSEPYLDSKHNYISCLNFELKREHPPQRLQINHTTSWAKIGIDLYDYDRFGGALNGASYWDSDWKKQDGAKDTMAHVLNVYNTIKEKVAWNGSASKYASRSLSKVLEEGSGNSADINLMLVAILHKEGIKADPVCLRLRKDGKLPYTRPSMSSLNYVVASVEVGGKLYLLDATEDYLPFGVLPERCINGQGIQFAYDGSISHINIQASQNYEVSTLCSFKINEDGSLFGNVDYRRTGYAGINARKKYDVKDVEEEMRKSFESKFPGVEIDSCSIVNKDSINNALLERYSVTLNSVAQLAGNMILINPAFIDRMEENPFKLADRMYPVDYGYPRSEMTVLSIELPEGYQVEAIPNPMQIALPDNGGVFVFKVQAFENRLQVMQKLAIDKSLFLPTEYQGLKVFYDHIVSKQNEQIILKKI